MSKFFPALPNAPEAAIQPTTTTAHGTSRHDNYAWLRADNWQEAMRDPSKLPSGIRTYLEAENAYFDAAMADTRDLQDRLVSEMRGRIKEADSSVPVPNGPFEYGVRYEDGAEHPIYERTRRGELSAETILDVNDLAAAHDYFDLGSIAMSPDHNILAWDADTNGSEFFALRFRDMATGQDAPTVISDVSTFAWADPSTLFYVKVDETARPTRLYRHRLHSDPKDDALVFTETDPRYGVSVSRSRSGAFIFVTTGMNDENEIYTISTSDPHHPPAIIEPRTRSLEYAVDHQDDHFVILTNADGAQDFKIVTAPISSPSRAFWTDLVPAQSGRMIMRCATFANWIVWTQTENALPQICILEHGQDVAKSVQYIAFDEEAYALGLQPGPEFDTQVLRFSYTSPTTPRQVFDYDLKTGTRRLRKTDEIPSGHKPSDYVARRIFARSHDGAMVPVTILHHKNTPLDGTAPCLLRGYGSYGISLPAAFRPNGLSLVDRGFIEVTAHVRGGQEKGRAWYEAAKFGKKVNSFLDFIAVATHLTETGYTCAGKIVIQGGSAGGLLVGAVANMRPDLWGGVIADVPFVDVLSTILDDSLPLTPTEWSQWGNPIESSQAYADIRQYSPYDNVVAQDYPAMLITAGVSDPRVTYWEPAKWAARLRATKTDSNILMLKTNMTSGHFGKSGRFAALDDAARTYAFAIKATGGL